MKYAIERLQSLLKHEQESKLSAERLIKSLEGVRGKRGAASDMEAAAESLRIAEERILQLELAITTLQSSLDNAVRDRLSAEEVGLFMYWFETKPHSYSMANGSFLFVP